MRIVSLAPSATEIVYALDRGDLIVGRSHECDRPPEVASVPAVTSSLPADAPGAADEGGDNGANRRPRAAYRLDSERLADLEPDLVLTQGLRSVCGVPRAELDTALSSLPVDTRVLATDPHSIDGVLDDIDAIGAAIGADKEAATLRYRLSRRLGRVARLVSDRPLPRVALVEWPHPIYAPGYWVPDMIHRAGGESVFGTPGKPWRRADFDDLAEARPEIVVLAFCGLNLYEIQSRLRDLADHPQWIAASRAARVVAIDAAAFVSRPGPRVVDGVAMLSWVTHRLHPDGRPPIGAVAELIEAGWVDLSALPMVTGEPTLEGGRPVDGDP